MGGVCDVLYRSSATYKFVPIQLITELCQTIVRRMQKFVDYSGIYIFTAPKCTTSIITLEPVHSIPKCLHGHTDLLVIELLVPDELRVAQSNEGKTLTGPKTQVFWVCSSCSSVLLE